MHKKPGAGKKTGARIDLSEVPGPLPDRAAATVPRLTRRRRAAPRSVNELLERGGRLRQLLRAIPAQQAWADWLRERLPAELAPHLISAVPKGSASARELVLLADSGAWSARLRYALEPLEAEIHTRDASIVRISVRVSARR